MTPPPQIELLRKCKELPQRKLRAQKDSSAAATQRLNCSELLLTSTGTGGHLLKTCYQSSPLQNLA